MVGQLPSDKTPQPTPDPPRLFLTNNGGGVSECPKTAFSDLQGVGVRLLWLRHVGLSGGSSGPNGPVWCVVQWGWPRLKIQPIPNPQREGSASFFFSKGPLDDPVDPEAEKRLKMQRENVVVAHFQKIQLCRKFQSSGCPFAKNTTPSHTGSWFSGLGRLGKCKEQPMDIRGAHHRNTRNGRWA